LDKIDWEELSYNKNAINLLKANQDKIDWIVFSKNSNPNMIDIVKENLDKIEWDNFSENPLIFYDEPMSNI
jgi:hypothetical protein